MYFHDVVQTVPPPNWGQAFINTIKAFIQKYGLANPGGKPPNNNNRLLAILCIVACVVWVALFILGRQYFPRLLFTMNVLTLMVLVSIAPIVSNSLPYSEWRLVRIASETIIVMGAVVLFTLSAFGAGYLGMWTVYTAGIILLLEMGGHFIEWYKIDTVSRLSELKLLHTLEDKRLLIDRIFRRQQVLYLSIPLGFIAGLCVGLSMGHSEFKIIELCIIAILSLASLALLFFLINGFVRMCDPMFTTGNVAKPVIEKKSSAITGILGGTHLVIIMPEAEKKDESANQDLNLAASATNLRKIYLFDAVHNTLLLVAFAAVMLSFRAGTITLTRVIVALFVSAFLFSQLPFGIGQELLHRRVLRRFLPTKEAKLKEELDKIAPRFPALGFLTSFGTTGAGSILFYLLNEAIKSRLKP